MSLNFRCLLFLVIFLAVILPVGAQTVNTPERSVTKVAENIYVIRHKDAPDDFPQGNTTVIIGDRDVVVIDACYLPSSAKEDIDQIRKWTNKPVRYLVNTHYHIDHVLGNTVYAKEFPNISIIALKKTKMLEEGNNTLFIKKYAAGYATQKQTLAAGKGADGKPFSAEERKELETALANTEKVNAELINYSYTSPNVAFSDDLILDLGNRVVELKFFGRGNTIGDLVTYLPKEKILVTGDLVVHPIPYAYLGYPSEWSITLKNLLKLDASIIVPGHGQILYDKTYISQLTQVIDVVVKRTEEVVYELGHTSRMEKVQQTIKAITESIDWAHYRKQFAGENEDSIFMFDDSIMGGLVRSAVSEVEAR